MRGAMILRRLVSGRAPCAIGRTSSITDNLIFTSAATATATYSTLRFADDFGSPFQLPAGGANNYQSALLNYSRNYSSSASSGSSKVVSIESEEQLNDSLRKVQDESLPAIFYFTAVWCGPCRFLSPVIEQMSEQYPHVTTYKIDINEGDLTSAVSKLDITSVPTLHFFQDGKKVGEVIGADVKRLKDTMERLYK